MTEDVGVPRPYPSSEERNVWRNEADRRRTGDGATSYYANVILTLLDALEVAETSIVDVLDEAQANFDRIVGALDDNWVGSVEFESWEDVEGVVRTVRNLCLRCVEVVAERDLMQAENERLKVAAIRDDREVVQHRWTAAFVAERAKVEAALAWLAKADPLPDLNGDKFQGLRAALMGSEQPL